MDTNAKYLVRQYRPGYCTGFTNSVFRDVAFADITAVPFCENFKHSDFSHFTISDYHGELIIEAHYKGGEHWVVGFALEMNSKLKASDGGLMRENWRYKEHES